MEDRNVNRNIPVSFEEIETIDDRFTKVKIWLMHLGDNLNMSVFTKDVVETALPTLANNPILGYIENNSDGEEDFSDHRTVIAKKNGQWVWKYKGSAYGVIPENNNAQWEMRVCDDGVEREFLTCEGLMWNKWDSPIDIMNRDISKAQSMELHDDYEGEFDENGKFHFTKFSFFGACILGKDVKPAMQNASVELFSTKDIASQIQFHLLEFERLMDAKHLEENKSSSEEGGSEVDEKLELLAKYNLTAEQLGVNLEEVDLATLEATAQDFVAKLQNNAAAAGGEGEGTGASSTAANADTTTGNTTEDVGSTGGEKTPVEFTLSAGQLREAIRIRLAEDGGSEETDWGWSISNYYYVDHTESEIIAESRADNWQLVGLGFSMNGDVPVIDFASKRRMKVVYSPLEGDTVQSFSVISDERKEVESKISEAKFSQEMDTLKGQLVSAQSEMAELKEFKASKIATERKDSIDNLFADSKFSQLTDEDVTEFKNECYSSEKSMEEIEGTLFAMLGRKFASKFSIAPVTKKPVKIEVVASTSNNSVKSYDGIVTKFTKK